MSALRRKRYREKERKMKEGRKKGGREGVGVGGRKRKRLGPLDFPGPF